MVTLDGIYNTPERLRLSSSFRGDTCTYDETSNERVFRCEKMDNFCTNSHLRGYRRASVFAAPVYAEELRTFASDAQHKGFASNIHAVILVGDATTQNYRVNIGGETFVPPIAGKGKKLHGIDRDRKQN